MIPEIKIDQLDVGNKDQIKTIAHRYFEEWNTPIERTFSRLENQPSDNVLFQLIATKENHVIATVGLSNNVNLTKTHKSFSELKPWIALLYTERKHRKQGVAKLLLAEVERRVKKSKLNEIYVYTFTAVSLYTKLGWKETERVNYKGHETVIMKKEIGH